VKIVEIDALGRLVEPKDLVSFAKISKEIVFPAVNIIEIWDKDLYEKSINGEDVILPILEEVMGNINDDDNGIIIRFC
jgi:MraZ protein